MYVYVKMHMIDNFFLRMDNSKIFSNNLICNISADINNIGKLFYLVVWDLFGFSKCMAFPVIFSYQICQENS